MYAIRKPEFLRIILIRVTIVKNIKYSKKMLA